MPSKSHSSPEGSSHCYFCSDHLSTSIDVSLLTDLELKGKLPQEVLFGLCWCVIVGLGKQFSFGQRMPWRVRSHCPLDTVINKATKGGVCVCVCLCLFIILVCKFLWGRRIAESCSEGWKLGGGSESNAKRSMMESQNFMLKAQKQHKCLIWALLPVPPWSLSLLHTFKWISALSVTSCYQKFCKSETENICLNSVILFWTVF